MPLVRVSAFRSTTTGRRVHGQSLLAKSNPYLRQLAPRPCACWCDPTGPPEQRWGGQLRARKHASKRTQRHQP
eukprot:1681664-Alexandrium_andersonii.AAC.1